MVRRLFLFAVVTALLVAAAVWLADRPGEVTVRWQGWRVDTSVPVVAAFLVLVLAAATWILRLVGAVCAAPRRWLEGRRARRTEDGYRALSDGLAATLIGDGRAAGKLAKRADRLLADPALTGLLSARAAELSGDAAEAGKRFEAMLDRPETAFLGLRGLMNLATERGDRAAALDYAYRAWGLNPTADGLAAALFDLQARAGQWAEAELTLAEAGKRGTLSGPALSRRRALALNERARLAEAAGDAVEGARLAETALKAEAGLTDAASRAARLFHRQGKARKAAAVIEAAWRVAPHPELVAAWNDLAPAEPALERVKRLEKLVRANADAVDGHLGLAEAALAAKLWGQARRHLEIAVEARPSRAAHLLLARLEREEKGDTAAAEAWIAKSALADAAWECGGCGDRPAAWSAACPSCGAIDALVWRQPRTS